MPWHIERKDGKHCVIKDADGSTEKCHMTASQAKAHMRALYASEKKETDDIAQKAVDGAGEEAEVKCMNMPMEMYVPFGVTSFAELMELRAAQEAAHSVHEMAGEFNDLVRNIMADELTEDKAGAIAALAQEFSGLVQAKMENPGEHEDHEEKAVWSAAMMNDLPDSSFLFIEAGGEKDGDGKTKPRSKRHFPYKDAAGKIDMPHLRNAIARIPQSDAPGLTPEKKRSLQARARKLLEGANKETNWFDELVGMVKEALGIGKPEPEPETGLLVWKEGDRYRWLAVFSNKYRDRDNPPEILTDAAHKEFVAAVDKGDWPMPELWHWHVPGSRYGQADWLAYDAGAGFPLASGWVDAGHEKEAEALAGLDEPILVSHGMPIVEIARDADDPTIIVRYRSKEISDLPAWAAANPLTGFHILAKEVTDMAIPDQKKDYLRRVGLTDERITQIEADLEGKAKEASEQGLEFKESELAQVSKDEVAEAAPAATTTETTSIAAEAPLSRAEVAEALTTFMAQMTQFGQVLETLAGEVKALKEADEDKVAAKAAATPAASLVDLVRGRAVGAEETRIDGRKVKGPKETKEAQVPLSPVPFLNQLITPQQQ